MGDYAPNSSYYQKTNFSTVMAGALENDTASLENLNHNVSSNALGKIIIYSLNNYIFRTSYHVSLFSWDENPLLKLFIINFFL